MGPVSLAVTADGIGVLRLDRPERRNALTHDVADALVATLDEVARDERIRSLVLGGVGGYFCAGGDLHEWERERVKPVAVRRALLRRLQAPVEALFEFDKPTIVAVGGGAAGAGIAFPLVADEVVMERGASFAFAFSKIGVLPDLGVLYWLPRVVGPHRARRLLLEAGTIRAEEAHAAGWVRELAGADDVLPAAVRLATALADGPAEAIAAGKRLWRETHASSFRAFLEREATLQAEQIGSPEASEGIEAFAERRRPDFRKTSTRAGMTA